MKYCVYCGAEIHEEAVICVRCGRSVVPIVSQTVAKQQDDTLNIIVKVFLILGCVAQGWLLLPLAWCLPITISVFRSFRDGKPVGTGMKICALLLVNVIAGICLLCMNDDT